MMEKIKDLLYDVSDIALSLLLVAVIALSITYKITDAFTLSIFEPDATTVIPVSEQLAPPEEPSSEAPPEEPVEPSEDEPVEITPPTKVQFKIEQGMTGYNIANLLHEKGLIQSIDNFIARVEELKLGSKLRTGTYSVSSAIDMDELIYVIAGQRP
ncbi:MAG: hypothetical protein AVO33_03670 [delta proteobacterium ML8_F1]|jgi:hypothetical protein|nr:MAG: hypothetical protein AVO33_03670 [delta proteobacterium ML8_F1]